MYAGTETRLIINFAVDTVCLCKFLCRVHCFVMLLVVSH